MFGVTRQARPSKAKRLSRMQLAKGAIGNMPARRASGSEPGGVARGRIRSKSRRPSRRRAALTQPPISGVSSRLRRPAVRRRRHVNRAPRRNCASAPAANRGRA